MNDTSIKKRKYYVLEVELASPLCVAGNESENTDKDILRNAAGIPFVPGTSIAGAVSEVLNIKIEKDTPNLDARIFGYSNGTDGRMSTISFSDLYFSQSAVSVRDGIELVDRQVKDKSKYDVEVIETGAKGIIYISCVIRDIDEKEYDQVIRKFVEGIQSGAVRFGSKKNRGFGRIRVCQVRCREFSKEQCKEYMEFERENLNQYGIMNMLNPDHGYDPEGFVSVKVPLKLTGGISIRRYSTRPNEADYEHISIGAGEKKIPVIPGSSWNGAIRSDVRNILLNLGCKQVDDLMKYWFGYIDKDMPETEKRRKDRRPITSLQSQIVIGESMIENSEALNVTRNKIDRYDASTITEALYTERSYFGGELELEMFVRKNPENLEGISYYKALLGILSFVIKDIQEGYLPVGGLVSVGRGIFEENGPVVFSEGDEAEYRKALLQLVGSYKKEA